MQQSSIGKKINWNGEYIEVLQPLQFVLEEYITLHCNLCHFSQNTFAGTCIICTQLQTAPPDPSDGATIASIICMQHQTAPA